MKKIIIVFGTFFCLCNLLIAQDTPVGEIRDAQIIIEKDKKLSLPFASKYYEKAIISLPKKDSIEIEYRISDYSLVPEPMNLNFQRAPFAQPNITSSYPGYVLADFGNYLALHLGAGYRTQKDDNGFSFIADHQSYFQGPVADEESAFSRTQLMAIGDMRSEKFSFTPLINYTNQRYHYYGGDYIRSLNQPVQGTFGITELENPIATNQIQLVPQMSFKFSDQVDLKLAPQFSLLKMNTAERYNQEVQIGLSSQFDYELHNPFQISIAAEINQKSYESRFESTRTILSFSPTVQYVKDDFQIAVGVNLTAGKDSLQDSMETYIYPLVSARVGLGAQLSVFAQVSGALTAPSLSSLLDQNRFLGESLLLLNENEKYNIKAGLDFLLIPGLKISPYFAHRVIENKSFFIFNSNSVNYQLAYESERFGQVDFGADIDYVSSKTTANASLVFSGYQTDLLEEAFNLPSATVSLSGSHAFTSKISANAYLMILDGMMSNGLDGTTSLDTIVDLGLGADYQISKPFSVYVKSTNLLNQNYERYQYFPVRGITGKLGFVYQF